MQSVARVLHLILVTFVTVVHDCWRFEFITTIFVCNVVQMSQIKWETHWVQSLYGGDTSHNNIVMG